MILSFKLIRSGVSVAWMVTDVTEWLSAPGREGCSPVLAATESPGPGAPHVLSWCLLHELMQQSGRGTQMRAQITQQKLAPTLCSSLCIGTSLSLQDCPVRKGLR